MTDHHDHASDGRGAENGRGRISPLRALVIALSFAAIASLTYLLVEDVRSLRVAGLLTPVHHARELFRRRVPGTAVLSPEHPDPSAIQQWMTFEYVNAVFGADAGYLRTKLGIADTRYPRVSIRRYARLEGEDPAALLARVKTAMTEFEAARRAGGR